MSNKKRFFLLGFIGLSVLAIFFVQSFIKVNRIYATPKESIHQMNDVLAVPKNEELTFSVKEAQLTKYEEVSQLVPDFYEQSKKSEYEYAVVTVTLTITNQSQEEQSIEELMIARLTMNNNYSNGIALPIMLEMNDGEVTQRIEAKQTIDVDLCYTLTDNNLKKSTYKNLATQDFYYTYRLSPDVERIKLVFN